MARFGLFTLVLLSAAALLSSPALAADRKLLQQVNVPITVQCINLLDNDQIANIPNLNLGIIQAIAGVLGGGQTPVALFWNGGSAENHCTNNQEFNNQQSCGSVVGPVIIPVLGAGYVIPCYGSGGNRKLLQQVNVPVTAQCLNVLDNDQILNVPNADVQIIGAIVSALGAAGQAPAALFLSSGSAENHCSNDQQFSNYQSCGSVIGPVLLPIGGEAFFTPCYGHAGNRKLLQQVNVPITVQCINLLDNDQIANIPNLNAGVIQAILGIFGTAQQPTALFFSSGTAGNQCSNNQEFNNEQKCGSVVGPIIVPVLGVGYVTPCYN